VAGYHKSLLGRIVEDQGVLNDRRSDTHQAILRRDRSKAVQSPARCSAHPRHCAAAIGGTAGPEWTCDHVVAVAQESDSGDTAGGIAHLIPRFAADEAICLRNDAACSCASVAPGHCSTTIGYATVPVRTCDHVVAVAQGSDARAAHLIATIATH